MYPVQTADELKRSYSDFLFQPCPVILVNCASSIDVVDFLEAEDSAVFYIIDSMRPFHVHNVYNMMQVKLLILPSALEAESNLVPPYDALFHDENEDNADYFNRTEWDATRLETISKYMENEYYRESSTFVVFDLAWKCSRDTSTLLWGAVVSVAYQYAIDLIDNQLYLDQIASLQSHASRLRHAYGNEASVCCLRINFIEDLKCSVLRQWTLWDSFYSSIYVHCLFRLWNVRGRSRLNEFLADLGISLQDAKRSFASLDSSVCERLQSAIKADRLKAKYHYDESAFFVPTFVVQFAHRLCCNAIDFAITLHAVLMDRESLQEDSSDLFVKAMRCFDWNDTSIEISFGICKQVYKKLISEMQNLLEAQKLISYGRFIHVAYQIEDESPDSLWNSISALQLLSQYLLQAHYHSTSSRKARLLPLILNVYADDTYNTLIGITCPQVTRINYFPGVFEKAIREAGITTASFPEFSRTVVKVSREETDLLLSICNQLVPRRN
ncbi:hypothetical protein GJ496_001286 [Pomphorhynchus laevis]|nr:hypothetical protein GJ496_001286 [Pomphorhynchus laevis]